MGVGFLSEHFEDILKTGYYYMKTFFNKNQIFLDRFIIHNTDILYIMIQKKSEYLHTRCLF